MKQVDQTIFGPKWNCFSACIASLLHLSLDEVPHFVKYEDWYERLQKWLNGRGLYPFYYFPTDPHDPDDVPEGYHVLTGKSPRYSDHLHCVVACGTVIVHDPMPPRTGLATREGYMVLVPLDPGEWTRKPAYTDEP